MKNSPRSPGRAAEECNLEQTTNSSQPAQQSTSDNQQQEKPQQAESASDDQQQDKPIQVKSRSDDQQQEKPKQAKQRPASGQQTPTREQNMKQIEQERKKRGMKPFTRLQREKVLQTSTQEVSNRGHKNCSCTLCTPEEFNWVRSTMNAKQCPKRLKQAMKAKHKQVMADKNMTEFYEHYLAMEKPAPRTEQEEQNIQQCIIDSGCEPSLHSGPNLYSPRVQDVSAVLLSPQCVTYTAADGTNLMQRMTQLELKVQQAEVQEMINNQVITRVDTAYQPAPTTNGTMQVVCSILATAVGMMMVIIAMLLSRQEEGYVGPKIAGRGCSKKPAKKVEEMDPYEPKTMQTRMHTNKPNGKQQTRMARYARELAEMEASMQDCFHKPYKSHCYTVHIPGAHNHTADQLSQYHYKGPRNITGKGRTGGCGGSSDEDSEEYSEYDDEELYQAVKPASKTKPAKQVVFIGQPAGIEHLISAAINTYGPWDSSGSGKSPSQHNHDEAARILVDQQQTTKCWICNQVFKPCKNAAPGRHLRSAKWACQQHSLSKIDDTHNGAAHKRLAEELQAEDPELEYWQLGRLAPGEKRCKKNWKSNTDQEWKRYIDHYNRHMRMTKADQEKALQGNRNLERCINRIREQWQTESVQFDHQKHTGELAFDQKFYDAFDEAYKKRRLEEQKRERQQEQLEDAEAERQYQESCRQRPPNPKQNDSQRHEKSNKKQKRQQASRMDELHQQYDGPSPKRAYKRNDRAQWATK